MRDRTSARRRRSRAAFAAGLAAAAVLAATGLSAGAGPAQAASSVSPASHMQAQATARVPEIVPKPVSMTTGRGRFTVTQWTRIVAASAR